MTVHASKGLEFPAVFIVGLEDQLFPSFRSMDDEEALEEERRLCYVAITRAEKLLFVSHARNRNHFGRFEARQPSVFLKEMAPEFMEGLEEKKFAQTFPEPKSKPVSFFDIKPQKKQSRSTTRVNVAPVQQKEVAPDSNVFKTGDKVMHKAFGTGMIVTVDQNKDALTIVFDAHGIKKLSASMAPIKIIG